MSKQLLHIDNNFYHVTASQARQLSIDGKLPRAGYMKSVDKNKLAAMEFGKSERYPLPGNDDSRRFRKFEGVIRETTQAWIQQTPLSWFNGAPVEGGQVWAVHIFNPQ